MQLNQCTETSPGEIINEKSLALCTSANAHDSILHFTPKTCPWGWGGWRGIL